MGNKGSQPESLPRLLPDPPTLVRSFVSHPPRLLPLAPLPSTAAAERSRPCASACPRPPVDDGAPGADVPRR